MSGSDGRERSAAGERRRAFWRDRRVFVTGATGLLGSWTVPRLLEWGAEVVCLLRDWVPASPLASSGDLSRCSVVRGELEDRALLVRALNEYEVDTVLHLGAQTIVGTASRSPLSTFESNVRGTWNLLDACRECARLIERVVVASSDKAYGEHETLPYREDTPLQGRFPYDVSKSCSDLISFSYHRTYGVPLAVTRCGNLYGGGDLNFNRLVPGTIRSALRDESPIVRSDGTYVRDYFYVRDAVDAYLLLAERLPEDGFVGEAFNFGTETPVSVLEVVAEILELTGKLHLEPTVLGEASHEIRRQYLDCAHARARMGWRARYTLREGLQETIEWYAAALSASRARDGRAASAPRAAGEAAR